MTDSDKDTNLLHLGIDSAVKKFVIQTPEANPIKLFGVSLGKFFDAFHN
jgi:hypothetical protein